MSDPCKAARTASRRNLRRLDLIKFVILAAVAAFTVLLVAAPSFASQLNFLDSSPKTSEQASALIDQGRTDEAVDGRLVVRVVPFREVAVIGEAGQPEIDGVVSIIDEAGEVAATTSTGIEVALAPGTYTVTVEADVPTPVPPKIVDIEADTLRDLVIEYQEVAPVVEEPVPEEPPAEGHVLVRVSIFGSDPAAEPIDAETPVVIKNEAGQVIEGVAGQEFALLAGKYQVTLVADVSVPPQVVEIEPGGMQLVVFAYQQPEVPDPNGRLLIDVLGVNPDTAETVPLAEPMSLTIFDTSGTPVQTFASGTVISVPPGKYIIGTDAPGSTALYVEAGVLTHIEFRLPG